MKGSDDDEPSHDGAGQEYLGRHGKRAITTHHGGDRSCRVEPATNDTRSGLVEAAGVEPASEAASPEISTSVSGNLISLGGSSRRDPLLPAAVTVLPQGRGAPAVAIRSM